MLRRSLERLTRRLVLRRQLPGTFDNAVLYVSPAVGLRFIFRSMARIDPPLLMAAYKLVKTGDVVWDIGANIGLFALAAAVRTGKHGKVIAFEPDVWLVQLLRRTSAAQPDKNAPITVVPVAVAAEVSLRRILDRCPLSGMQRAGRIRQQSDGRGRSAASRRGIQLGLAAGETAHARCNKNRCGRC